MIFPKWQYWTESKRVSDNLLKSLNFFLTKWTDFCPLCPLALSNHCPPAVQRKNKYSIYFSGRKIPYLFSGWKNTRINSDTRKILYLFSGWKISELFGQLRNISVPELSYGTAIRCPIPLGGQPRPPSHQTANWFPTPPSSLRGS